MCLSRTGFSQFDQPKGSTSNQTQFLYAASTQTFVWCRNGRHNDYVRSQFMCQHVSRKKKKKIQKSKCEVNLALLKIIKPFGMFRRVKINRVTDVSKDHSTFIKVFKPKKWNSKNRQRNFRFGECYRNMFRTYRIIRLISLMILMILKGRNMFP